VDSPIGSISEEVTCSKRVGDTEFEEVTCSKRVGGTNLEHSKREGLAPPEEGEPEVAESQKGLARGDRKSHDGSSSF
jgi:hypothetical protein